MQYLQAHTFQDQMLGSEGVTACKHLDHMCHLHQQLQYQQAAHGKAASAVLPLTHTLQQWYLPRRCSSQAVICSAARQRLPCGGDWGPQAS